MEIQTVLITGGTGLVGMELSEYLHNQGIRVIHYSRTENLNAKFPAYPWNIKEQTLDVRAIEAADAIVHLAGANVGTKRWSESRKKEIIESRVRSIQLLSKTLKITVNPPKVFIGASAIGIYGDTGDQMVTEVSPVGEGFLAETSILWEAAYQDIPDTIRKAVLRIGIVLSDQGGALEKMALSFKFRAGVYFGAGDQFYSWIHIEDLVKMFAFAILENKIHGVFNAVAPNPATNKVFIESIALAKGKKALIHSTPSFLIKMAMGEMAAIVLEGSKVSSQKIQEKGFTFDYADLIPALTNLLNK